jgi:hypothetical protein
MLSRKHCLQYNRLYADRLMTVPLVPDTFLSSHPVATATDLSYFKTSGKKEPAGGCGSAGWHFLFAGKWGR